MRPEPRPRSRRQVLAVLGALSVAGCTAYFTDDTESTPATTPTPDPNGTPADPAFDPDWEPASGSPLEADVTVEVLVENLEIPWDIAFDPDGGLFLTERTGRVSRFDETELETIREPEDAIDAGAVEPGDEERPWWVEGGEGGTLGVAVHPSYPDPSYVYVYYTATSGGSIRNRVVRYDVSDTDPNGTSEVVVDDIPADTIHNGGRIDFGPEGYLWILTGDAGEESLSQDPDSLAGKILRTTPSGEPAPDNPELDDADPRIFTTGHRNPQGISWLPDGTPIVTEHGPSARDEIILLRPGANNGWPEARDEEDYVGSGYGSPLVNTGPGDTWAPSGCTVYTGDVIPEWHNRLLVGGLVSQQLVVVTLTRPDGELPPLDGDSTRYDADWLDDEYVATAHRVLEDELGRIRHVAQSPSGELYAITSNRDGRAERGFPTDSDDVLVRLTVS